MNIFEPDIESSTPPPTAMPETIRYAFEVSSLCTVAVAVGDNGVAAIMLGDDRDALVLELAAAFPSVRLSEDCAGLSETMLKVISFLEAPGQALDLPLDLRGSAVERAVWEAVGTIPPGQTTTYGQIAKRLPAVTAQDVAAACSANKHAVAIPCHRVVKADGSISGYRWGVRLKRKLLRREAIR